MLSGARTILRGMSGYVLRLGGLVNARRSLYQSKPSIEASKANTAPGGCNPENRPDWRRAGRVPNTRGWARERYASGPPSRPRRRSADLDHELRSVALVEHPQADT
jgi:hypothetical protein